MRKELLEVYMRLCTVQMNVFKDNVPKCHSFEITIQRSGDNPASYSPYIYINAHCIKTTSTEPVLKHWWVSNNDTSERFNTVLQEISEYIGFEA